MEGKHEKLTIEVEELEKKFQRKCEETEGLQLIIERKENMETVKAAADVLCYKQVEDLNDIQKARREFRGKGDGDAKDTEWEGVHDCHCS